MKPYASPPQHDASARASLRSRVKQFYHRFNQQNWQACYSLIDPRLTQQAKVELSAYCDLMAAFKKVYGSVHPWHTRLSLHLEGASKGKDKRPFAYVYVVWQDDAHEFHMFRERWVKENGRWYTRVVGLVPNRRESASMKD